MLIKSVDDACETTMIKAWIPLSNHYKLDEIPEQYKKFK